jgi:DNA recombination protein RmuC
MEVHMEITGIVTIVVLLILVALFIWDRSRQEKRWREQSDALSRTVGERIADTTRVFGEVKESLGKLAKGTEQIEAVGRDISSLSGEAVDAIIEIGDRKVPIDSKFPLEDFQRMLAAESDAERASLRKQFTRTVKKHIDDVAKYIRPDEGTFDFALMYIPAENVYYETILREGTEEGGVYSYALEKRIIPVSPNSFYAYLQVIMLGLKGLHIEQAAGEILNRLARLQNDFTGFQGDFETLGGHIHRTGTKYEEAGRKLDRFGDRLKLTSETPAEQLSEGGKASQDSGEV